QRNPLLAAGNRDERVVEERWLLVKKMPTLARGERGEHAAALGESGVGRGKHTATALKWLEHTLVHVARRPGGTCSRGELLHHNSAEVRERKRSVEERKDLGLGFLAPETVGEDVRIERVLHAFCRRSNTSATPPLRRTAANALASSSRKATKSRA